MDRDAMLNRTEEEWDALEDAIITVYGLKAGSILSDADIAALNLVDKCHREDDESATDAFHAGREDGLRERGGNDLVEAHARADRAVIEKAAERAMRVFDRQDGFRGGLLAMREMLARFVEQGGDAVTAASLRANWSPEWGADPVAAKDGTSDRQSIPGRHSSES